MWLMSGKIMPMHIEGTYFLLQAKKTDKKSRDIG